MESMESMVQGIEKQIKQHEEVAMATKVKVDQEKVVKVELGACGPINQETMLKYYSKFTKSVEKSKDVEKETSGGGKTAHYAALREILLLHEKVKGCKEFQLELSEVQEILGTDSKTVNAKGNVGRRIQEHIDVVDKASVWNKGTMITITLK